MVKEITQQIVTWEKLWNFYFSYWNYCLSNELINLIMLLLPEEVAWLYVDVGQGAELGSLLPVTATPSADWSQWWLIRFTDTSHIRITDRQASAKPSWPHSTWTLWHHNSEKSIDQHADSAAGSHHKLKRHTTFLLFASENRYALRLSPLYWWRWTNREIRGSDLWPGL